MVKRYAVRLSLLIAVLSVLVPSQARAQFTPRTLNDPATGEAFHIEGAIGIWMPSTSMTISSEALGIEGSQIDFKKDLGLTDQKFSEFHVVLRPARKHKLRFQYIPINFDQEATLTRDVIFQGIRYRVGLPVNSQLKWKAYRFAYEYDFITRNRGFAGFILDAKYTDVIASLQSPIDFEQIHARAPIPTIGGIGRYYIVPNISITGELTGFKIPDSISKQYKAHYADLDIYGTLNFTNNFGVQGGFRTFDVGYNIKDDDQVTTTDAGSFVLKGLYIGAVARF
ncbi:MAG TPA: hypothetical protein VM032_05630 [Vicinamibacterales bacterium]|nr:hypothetical protein [Vicinamibacterales bacterium]